MIDDDRAGDIEAELEALRSILDRLALLLVAVLALQLFHVFGGASLTGLVVAGLFGLAGLFVVLVVLGVTLAF